MAEAYEDFIRGGQQLGLFSLKYTTYNNQDLTYLIGGNLESRTAVVGVHGSPGSADNLKVYFESAHLSSKTQIVSYDRPGFGLAKHATQFNSLEEEALYLDQIIKTISADTIIFLGHSYGSSVVLKYLTLIDCKTYQAILIGSPIDPALEKGNWWRRPCDSKIIRWLIPQSLRRCNAEIVALKEELHSMKIDLSQIKSPIIFYHGTEDMLVPIENVHYFKQMNTHTNHHYIDIQDDGHFIIWTKKDEIIDLLLSSYDG